MLKFANDMAKQQMQTILKELKNAPPEVADKLMASLVDKFKYLSRYACQNDAKFTQCVLYKDHEPFSFIFTMRRKNDQGEYKDWFAGGLIFHSDTCGKLSIVLENVHGWSVHT